eukprot:TRINITY_DN13486_c0_g3_i1.p2 TRINITY_DN13486_c0_g3~~TRINITY_DN13486_c0_g3_i1.p2  ORF type:complete len:310 (+),score=19.30 TRINITY_DN13486_c0_g3_i1:84-932(+)
MATAFNQGVYGLVVKLGSLVVRSVLQPLEESAFIMFAKTAPLLTAVAGTAERAHSQQAVGQVLLLSLKAVNLLGIVFVCFGPPFSFSLLSLLYGRTWTATEAPVALACYCPYILTLAVNGITEAFVHAVVSERQLAASNWWLALFSAAHMALSAALIRVAASPGLILANCINMAMRIVYSTSFIRQYFKDSPGFSLLHSLPSPPVLLAFAASAGVSLLSQQLVLFAGNYQSPLGRASLTHIAVGCACLAGVAASIWRCERPFLQEVRGLLRSSKRKGKGKEE